MGVPSRTNRQDRSSSCSIGQSGHRPVFAVSPRRLMGPTAPTSRSCVPEHRQPRLERLPVFRHEVVAHKSGTPAPGSRRELALVIRQIPLTAPIRHPPQGGRATPTIATRPYPPGGPTAPTWAPSDGHPLGSQPANALGCHWMTPEISARTIRIRDGAALGPRPRNRLTAAARRRGGGPAQRLRD
jgi:hypothetical protein